MSVALYVSGWNPVGAKKSWDRCSMEQTTSAAYLGVWAERAGGQLLECVGWFDDDGAARIIVADFDNGKRLVVRCLARSTKISFERVPEALRPVEKAA